ncbi:hypothetical protein TEA_011885 [Camellia sinensis var. sinensis]|uniref:Uncharacterized protein n=1 Tax=Camellia sinensis var. sinensis TaxID=542762 RepID=A0A4S4DXD4_CAMSN|nr:hypothetical protein TEA_011885 [Camellia sinensis var. sinensis]
MDYEVSAVVVVFAWAGSRYGSGSGFGYGPLEGKYDSGAGEGGGRGGGSGSGEVGGGGGGDGGGGIGYGVEVTPAMEAAVEVAPDMEVNAYYIELEASPDASKMRSLYFIHKAGTVLDLHAHAIPDGNGSGLVGKTLPLRPISSKNFSPKLLRLNAETTRQNSALLAATAGCCCCILLLLAALVGYWHGLRLCRLLAISGLHALGCLGPMLGHVGALPTATLEHSNGHTTTSETSRS